MGFFPYGTEVLKPDQAFDIGGRLGNLALTGSYSWTGSAASTPLADAPGGGGLTINDNTADYGTIPAGSIGECQTTGDCYNVTANGPRPGPHWDEALTETLSTGVSKTWLLHVGDSFGDVPGTNPFYAFIENIFHNGVTAGGACGGYCPTDGVKRQQMAVFLLKSRFGSTFVPPPATGTIFTDVTLANPFASWIEALFLLGVTGGCSGGPPPAPTQFCPEGDRQPPADGRVPPEDARGLDVRSPRGDRNLRGRAGNQSVPRPSSRSSTTGRSLAAASSPRSSTARANPTNRQQMAAFLVKTFGLLLYGP